MTGYQLEQFALLPRRLAEIWTDYKLGDAIEGWNRPKVSMPFIDLCCGKYPGSIVCDYRRMTREFSDVNTLMLVVTRRALLYHTDVHGCRSLPFPGQTIVHLRLGDTSTSGPLRLNPLEHYARLIGRNITVVANPQRTRASGIDSHNQTLVKSLRYMEQFHRYVAKASNRILYRTNCLPDEDFVFMAHAERLVPAKGGYSHLVYETNKQILSRSR